MATKITNLAEFRRVTHSGKVGCLGCTFSTWDLLHPGHLLFLADSKSQCDVLCVGIQVDPSVDRPEKNAPIQTLEEREILVKSCRYVDFYFIYTTEASLVEFLEILRPDVRFLGDDYIGKKYTGDNLGIPVVYHPRSLHTFSSTALRKRIYEAERLKWAKGGLTSSEP